MDIPQSLDTALNAANFDPGLVQPGFLQSYRDDHGALFGLPISQMPLAVRWRRDVFASLGLPPPTGDWSMADFEEACQFMAEGIERGHAPDLLAALYPMFSYDYQFGIGANRHAGWPSPWGMVAPSPPRAGLRWMPARCRASRCS